MNTESSHVDNGHKGGLKCRLRDFKHLDCSEDEGWGYEPKTAGNTRSGFALESQG